jgi:hypothetical protein
MNNLASVSKILYDREVIEKNKENFELKKKLKKYETPKVLYENEDEWEELKNKEFSKLEIEIKDWCSKIHYQAFQYEIDSVTIDCVYQSIEKCLLNLTKNIFWSNFNAYYIIVTIEKCLKNLSHFKISIYDLEENLSSMVYGSIIDILDELLFDVPNFENSSE